MTFVVGIAVYVLISYALIYYNMCVKHNEPLWLKIYLPLNLVVLIGLIVYYSAR
jgi:uncharacterized membrane-anchored protein